jgi:hypothetical protein
VERHRQTRVLAGNPVNVCVRAAAVN